MHRIRENFRAAFTLAEMLVVLVILAVLTFIAVESLKPMADQARFDATRKTLQNVRQALIGDPTASDAAGVRGFVADVGRFPTSLDELVAIPADCIPTTPGELPFRLRPGPGIYAGIQIPCGWRGPYVLIPPGANTPAQVLSDGWGMPLQLTPPANTITNPSLVTYTIGSPANPERTLSAPEYAGDIAMEIQPNEWHATLITGSLFRLDGGIRSPPIGDDMGTHTWGVAMLAPDAVNGPNLGVQVIPAIVQTNSTTGDVTFSLNGVTGPLRCGPRVLQATLDGALAGRPVFLHLQPGSTHVVDIKVE